MAKALMLAAVTSLSIGVGIANAEKPATQTTAVMSVGAMTTKPSILTTLSGQANSNFTRYAPLQGGDGCGGR